MIWGRCQASEATGSSSSRPTKSVAVERLTGLVVSQGGYCAGLDQAADRREDAAQALQGGADPRPHANLCTAAGATDARGRERQCACPSLSDERFFADLHPRAPADLPALPPPFPVESPVRIVYEIPDNGRDPPPMLDSKAMSRGYSRAVQRRFRSRSVQMHATGLFRLLMKRGRGNGDEANRAGL